MAVIHVNRKGETYYLLVGRTKSGKPKFYTSKKPGENSAEVMPEGYEIYESPADGAVYARLIRPTCLVAMERELVRNGVRDATGKQHFFVEIQQDALVVYWPERDPEAVASFFSRFSGSSKDGESMSEWTTRHVRYTPELRFVLVDPDKRRFAVDRMCYRGGEEKWNRISGANELEKQVAKFAQHLGRDSFFEL